VHDSVFFIDVVVPDLISLGEKVEMKVFWYNKNFFKEYKLSKGEVTMDRKCVFNKEIIIDRTINLYGDFQSIELSSDIKGCNYWSGVLEGYFEEGGDRYAAFPIHLTYYVE